MAFDALIPFSVVFTAVDREILIVMIESRRHPTIYTMTSHAIRRKSCRNVVGIIGRVVIAQVTTDASARRVGVIAVVTRSAVVGNGSMRPAQNPIIVVNRESCRIPIRVGRMAHCTISWNAKCDVVGVGTAVKIGQVTADTSVWGIDIVALVAGVAVVGNRDMSTGERIKSIVVKRGRNPGIFRMAVSAGGRELGGCVIGVDRRIVIRLVAPRTSIGRIVIIAVVAGRAIIGDDCVRPVQNIIVVVDREGRRIPTGRSRMAHRTIRGQP